MNLEKTAKVAGDWRTIWSGILALLVVAAWVGDTRWLQIANAGEIANDVEYRILKQQKAQMVIEKSYEDDAKKKRLLEALIINTQSEMDAIKDRE